MKTDSKPSPHKERRPALPEDEEPSEANQELFAGFVMFLTDLAAERELAEASPS